MGSACGVDDEEDDDDEDEDFNMSLRLEKLCDAISCFVKINTQVR